MNPNYYNIRVYVSIRITEQDRNKHYYFINPMNEPQQQFHRSQMLANKLVTPLRRLRKGALFQEHTYRVSGISNLLPGGDDRPTRAQHRRREVRSHGVVPGL